METNNLRKFKLIKEYPGSPKLATELTPKVDKENTDTNNFYWEGSWFNPNDFSEFWEEVLQKDYEILRTCPIVGTIYAVKRLSDGEVFTVGDLIKTPYTDCTPITGFNIKYSTEYFIEIPTGFTRLVSIEKVKNPIFLTHDGKDIFPEDTVWYVNKENFYHDYITAYPEVKFNSEIRAYFLTEEAAVDYINKNKPRLSTEDCFRILQNWHLYGLGFKESIEKYVRENNK